MFKSICSIAREEKKLEFPYLPLKDVTGHVSETPRDH